MYYLQTVTQKLTKVTIKIQYYFLQEEVSFIMKLNITIGCVNEMSFMMYWLPAPIAYPESVAVGPSLVKGGVGT